LNFGYFDFFSVNMPFKAAGNPAIGAYENLRFVQNSGNIPIDVPDVTDVAQFIKYFQHISLSKTHRVLGNLLPNLILKY